ncbi:hypothetical protein PORCRE_657 [Porphyromonas crevioricanis JCM 15906]|uniref:Uncharacterized protein n=1 Tax=Porphyromonas crevioricanis JCM 15906 TaxID=1305617 RepID=T1DQU5_9PORP|nr:hypothetical protein PORCRE_657 [Porphyromonas crevioricanis JCM 15906]GAD07472.1 hypothetical protein PORCAN_1093 [Porphyromonas crevioricanis JCM 13913]
MIDTPFGARVFVGQIAICPTKTHLAMHKRGVGSIADGSAFSWSYSS